MSNGPKFVAWNPRDFDESTEEWDVAAVGIYVRLLNRQAKIGDIPADPRLLARLVMVDEAVFEHHWRCLIREKFEPLPDDPQRLQNPRMAEERERALVASGGASKAAKERWRRERERRAAAEADAIACTGADAIACADGRATADAARVSTGVENSSVPNRDRQSASTAPKRGSTPTTNDAIASAIALSSSRLSLSEEEETEWGDARARPKLPSPQEVGARSLRALAQAELPHGCPEWLSAAARRWVEVRVAEAEADPGESLRELPRTASRWVGLLAGLRAAGQQRAEAGLAELERRGWRSWLDATLAPPTPRGAPRRPSAGEAREERSRAAEAAFLARFGQGPAEAPTREAEAEVLS